MTFLPFSIIFLNHVILVCYTLADVFRWISSKLLTFCGMICVKIFIYINISKDKKCQMLIKVYFDIPRYMIIQLKQHVLTFYIL